MRHSRFQLYKFIQENKFKGSKNNILTVVFDGKEDVISNETAEGISIIFSKNKSADCVIMELIESSSQPKNMVLVTDDKELIIFARSKRVKLMPVKQLLAKKKTVIFKKKMRITTEDARKINRELRNIWLNEAE
ncbi:MAG: NYN domain-containing protein [Candidatus Gygaella obscura]|nr:NYN domain-containing protein [Candidatus Gygaella obscura]